MADQNQIERFSDSHLATRIDCEAEGEHLRESATAFAELYRRYAPMLLAFVSARVPKGEAEDIAQVVWIRVWKNAHEQFHGGLFRAWLLRIARNLVTDGFRSTAARERLQENAASDSSVEQPEEQPVENVLNQERRQILAECFDKLEDREALVLRSLLSGQSYADTCDAMQINENVAYKAASSARSKLKQCVEARLG